jgi:hypothetical protein
MGVREKRQAIRDLLRRDPAVAIILHELIAPPLGLRRPAEPPPPPPHPGALEPNRERSE